MSRLSLSVMAIREIVAPNSFDQILYVVLLWIAITGVITQVYDSPLIRLDIGLGTGSLMIWVVWGVRYRLEQIRKERYNRTR